MAGGLSQEDRVLAALGYPIWILAVVILITEMKQRPFMRAHAVQALGYNIAWVVIAIGLSVITGLPGLWRLAFLQPLVYLAWFGLGLVYGWRAYNGQTFDVPVVGPIAARYAEAGK